VVRLQRALLRSTYDPGPVDGSYGSMTQHAVYAFEKVEGLELDGVVSRNQMRRILRASPPKVPQRGLVAFVDTDVGRQVLLEVREGQVVHTMSISTGNGQYYDSTSGPAIARTPRGSFQIHSKIEGWRIGYLGAMYYPSYFYDGYAIHGSSSVPPYPASHGCIRIPMHSAVGFFERNPIGTPVFVHD
jgi:peptidoglycan hydrolase-like protein with peptidoglycan-binding domain